MLSFEAALARATAVSDANLVAMLSDLIPQAMDATDLPGMNVAVARRGHVIWETGFGYADRATGRQMQPDTIALGGSVTKLYTTVAFLQLVERGCVSLFEDVNPYLDYELLNPLGGREIRAYDLLTFTSGEALDVPLVELMSRNTLAPWLAAEAHQPTHRPYGRRGRKWITAVGNEYHYANVGFAHIARIVERLNPDKLSFAEYVAAHIAEPLGMASTVIPVMQTPEHVSADLLNRRATGYSMWGPHAVESKFLHTPMQGASGLLTTPGDHIRFLLAMQNAGTYNGNQILRPETVRYMLSPHRRIGGPELDCDQIGLCFELGAWDTEGAHFGRRGQHPFGWMSLGRVYPVRDLAVVICANRWDMTRWYQPDDTTAFGVIANLIDARLAAGPSRHRPVRSWDWKKAYVIGFANAERYAAFMDMPPSGITESLSPFAPGVAAPDLNADGFHRGVQDLLNIAPSADRIHHFLRSDEMEILPEEFRVIWLQLTGRATPSLPLKHWAEDPNVARPVDAAFKRGASSGPAFTDGTGRPE